MGRIAVFAGSFDPFTTGHYDIVSRAAGFFDKIIVGVAADTGGKRCILSVSERELIVKASLKDIENAEVKSFGSFLVDFAHENGASVIVRGLRTLADFEYEKALSEVYKSQNADLETFYLISSHNFCHVSGTIVRELARLGGNIEGYVQKNAEDLVKKFYFQRSL